MSVGLCWSSQNSIVNGEFQRGFDVTGEEEVLAVLGKIVVQWNYAEHCSRQIIRKRITDGSISDADHINLSKRTPKWMEDELRDRILPDWIENDGEAHLQSLIAAFAAAREYRNYYVHGIWATVSSNPAKAVVVPSKPHENKVLEVEFVTAVQLHPIAVHIEEMGAFACGVSSAFDVNGSRILQESGEPAISDLPQLIEPLPKFPYKWLDE